MTSYSHQLTQTKHKNRQTIETKDTCFSEENFIDRSFLVLEILREGGGGGGDLCHPAPMATQAKKVHGEYG